MSLTIDLSGRRALITGVTSGIGAGIARVLAQAGCTLAGCGLEAPDHPAAQAFLATAGAGAFYAACDLAEPSAPSQFVQQAVAALGGLEIVISNAGRNVFVGAAAGSEADWEACINLNLAAHWRLCQAARPFLQAERQPVIIIMSSVHAQRTLAGCFPYNIAKAGLVALVQSLTLEWGRQVRTVGLAPGFIDTAGNQTWFDSFPDPMAERQRTVARHPVGRLGTAEEIGGLCAFLCSPYAGFIAGTTLVVDGGRAAVLQDG